MNGCDMFGQMTARRLNRARVAILLRSNSRQVKVVLRYRNIQIHLANTTDTNAGTNGHSLQPHIIVAMRIASQFFTLFRLGVFYLRLSASLFLPLPQPFTV